VGAPRNRDPRVRGKPPAGALTPRRHGFITGQLTRIERILPDLAVQPYWWAHVSVMLVGALLGFLWADGRGALVGALVGEFSLIITIVGITILRARRNRLT